MKHFRKAAAIFLAVLLLTFALPAAFAEEDSLTYDFPQVGMTLVLPEAFRNLKGEYIIDPYGEVDDGIWYTEMYYLGATEEEYQDFTTNAALTEDQIRAFYDQLRVVCTFFCIDGGRDFNVINSMLQDQLDVSAVIEAESVDGCTHFVYVEPETEYLRTLRDNFIPELEALRASVPELVEQSSFFVPVSRYDGITGSQLSFETTDTEGNTVTSEDLFAGSRVTMVNIWASWCGPCIRELPELQAISTRLAEKDCAVVGLLYDGDDPDALEAAKSIMEENGVTYTVLLPPQTVDDLFPLEAFPTTLFVNSEGVIVGEPIVGAYVDRYEPTVESLLAE